VLAARRGHRPEWGGGPKDDIVSVSVAQRLGLTSLWYRSGQAGGKVLANQKNTPPKENLVGAENKNKPERKRRWPEDYEAQGRLTCGRKVIRKKNA